MYKRLFSVFLAFSLLLSLFSFNAFADDSHQHTFENKREYDLTNLPSGYQIPFTVYEAPCSGGCGYSEYSWNVFGISGKFIDKTGTPALTVYKHYREWFEGVYGQNATATKAPTGIGRKDLPGFQDDKGTPTYNVSGKLQFVIEPFGLADGYYREHFCYADSYNLVNLVIGSSGSGTSYPSDTECVVYVFTAPCDGVYYASSFFSPYVYGSISIFSDNAWRKKDLIRYTNNEYYASTTLKAGQKCYYTDSTGAYHYVGSTKYWPSGKAYRYELNPITIFVDPVCSSVTANKKITINNNTWNGNIYTDNSTNLTYIYPEYTTINENNETVTNISENPIIYNSETNQYYTYDSTTNNYYYITYEQPATPTPSPSPTPDPGTNPTPKPGGDSGDISTPETSKPGSGSGSSWWDKLLSKIGDAIIDGLLGAISGVLKLIFKLFSTILGWIIWAVSRVFDLLPFLPPGLGSLLVGGVVVCFVIGIIKFIRG